VQAGEVIWLFAGIGIGLTAAMLILAAVLVVDGQRLRRRVSQGAAPAAAFPPAPRPSAIPETPRRPVVEARPKPVPVAPPPPPKVLEPIVADPKVVAPAAVVVDEMMTDLAAEIARMQTIEPVTVAAELPPPVEPVRVVAEPAAPPPPEPEPVAIPASEPVTAPPAPPVPEPAAAPIAEAPVAAQPPAPKVPPLPKVTPARKFAPALPPRDPKT
jgi:DNA polymerase-3 subunit gamma/tau